MNNLNTRQKITIGVIALLLVGFPLALTLSQQRQEVRQRASASTSIYLTPNSSPSTPLIKNVGETVSYDIMLNPGANLASLVKLEILYDPTKMKPTTTNAIVVNSDAFPKVLEGPLINNGSILLSLSIGSDATKAIQTTTKVGTVSFTTLAPTSATATVSFSNRSQVLSVASTDQSTENVLSTTNPAYLTIVTQPSPTEIPSATATSVPTTQPSATPSPTANPTQIPTPTKTPTPTQTVTTGPTDDPTATILPTAIASITSGVTPTEILTLTPTTNPSGTTTPATTLSFTIFMHGVGNSGDNVSPNYSLSNKEPVHPARDLQVFVYNVSNQLVASSSGMITYASESGNFKGTVAFNVPLSGLHTIKVQSAGHLRRLVSGIQTLNPLQTNVIPEATLIAGDVNTDNKINIIDYNLIVGCYSDLLPPVACTEAVKGASDLNDDSFVNQFDYNMFLREISVQSGN